jgi:hypothetical protein
MEISSLTDSLKGAMTLREAAKVIPRRPSVTTVYRWCQSGCRGTKLRSWLVGGHRVTTQAAIEEFLIALNQESAPPSETEKDRLRRAEAAGKALEALGC